MCTWRRMIFFLVPASVHGNEKTPTNFHGLVNQWKHNFKNLKRKKNQSFRRLKIRYTIKHVWNEASVFRYLCYRLFSKVFSLCSSTSQNSKSINFSKQNKSWRDLSILYAIRYFTYVIYLLRLTIITATIITMTASKTPRIYPTNSPVEIFSGGFTMTADSPEKK